MGYSSSEIYKRKDSKHAAVMSMIGAGEIIVTRSHGNAFEDSDGNYIGNWIVLPDKNLYNSDIEDLKSGALSNAKLIVYGACKSAAGGVSSATIRNLTVASEVKGASTVVGFTKEVSCVAVNFWVKKFFQYLSEGYNIDKALNQAKVDTQNQYSGVTTNIDSCVYRGEWSATFN